MITQSEVKIQQILKDNYCSLELFTQENKSKGDSIETLSQLTNKYDISFKELLNKLSILGNRIN